MKLKELNPQPGQVYQRLDLPEWCIIMPNGDAKLVLDGSTCSCFYRVEEVEGDWQLLQPAPVLGEVRKVSVEYCSKCRMQADGQYWHEYKIFYDN